MIKKEIKGKEYLFVEVPEDSYDFLLSRDEVGEPTYISYKQTGNTRSPNYREGEDLEELYQPEWYIIIGKADTLSEEQWKGIVEPLFTRDETIEDEIKYEDFIQSELRGWTFCGFSTATQSGLSLIKSIGMKPETTLIIEKVAIPKQQESEEVLWNKLFNDVFDAFKRPAHQKFDLIKKMKKTYTLKRNL